LAEHSSFVVGAKKKKAKPCVVTEGREEVLAEMFVWDALLI